MSMARGGRVVLVGQSWEPADPGPILAVSFLGIGLLGHLGYRKQHLGTRSGVWTERPSPNRPIGLRFAPEGPITTGQRPLPQ
jgi:hypothetical protein